MYRLIVGLFLSYLFLSVFKIGIYNPKINQQFDNPQRTHTTTLIKTALTMKTDWTLIFAVVLLATTTAGSSLKGSSKKLE